MKKEKASKTYYADFETTQPSEDYGVEVYLWCVVSGDYKECGYDIVSFYKWLIERPKCRIYFHNLSILGFRISILCICTTNTMVQFSHTRILDFCKNKKL